MVIETLSTSILCLHEHHLIQSEPFKGAWRLQSFVGGEIGILIQIYSYLTILSKNYKLSLSLSLSLYIYVYISLVYIY